MSLFPAYSASTGEVPSTTDTDSAVLVENSASAPLFPSLQESSADNNIQKDAQPSTSGASTYKSYQPDILEVWQEQRKQQLEILLSSDDEQEEGEVVDSSDDASDSSVKIIGEIRSKSKDKKSSKHKSSDRSSKKHRKKDKKAKKKKKKRSYDDDDERSRSSRSSKHRRDGSSRDDRKHRSSRRSRSRSPRLAKTSEPTTVDNSYLEFLPRRANFLEDIPNLKSEHAYRIDRKPDGANRAFQTMHQPQVPKYLTRDVLDLTKFLKNEEKKTKIKKIKRYFKVIKKSKKNISDSVAQTTHNNTGQMIYPRETLTTEQDYIPVADLPSENNRAMENSSNSSTIRFKSMENPDEQENNNNQIGPSNIANRSQLYHELTGVFNRLTNNNSESTSRFESTNNSNATQLWIDFIRFQDLRLLVDYSSNRKFVTEKKSSIISKALERNRRSVALNLVRLKLMSSNYADLGLKWSEVDAEWKKLCFLFPNIPELWFDYSKYTIRSQSVISFRAVNRTRKVLVTAFKNLSGKVLEGDFQSHEIDLVSLEKKLVDLIGISCGFLNSVDQSEKAIAIYQALIEFNLFTPTDLGLENDTFEDWFLPFEQFWDSGLSRIGEFASIGWSSFRELALRDQTDQLEKDSKNLDHFNPDALLDRTENKILDEFIIPPTPTTTEAVTEAEINSQIWLHFERLRHLVHWLPASSGSPLTSSMEDVEDLERVVLSDEDVKPFLFRLRNPESKYYLVRNFIEYLGLPRTTHALDSAHSTSRFEYEFAPSSSTTRTLSPEFQELDSICTADYSKIFETFSKNYRRFEFASEVVVLRKFGLEELMMGNGSFGLSLRTRDDLTRVDSTDRDLFINNVMEKMVDYYTVGSNSTWYRDLILIWIRYKLKKYSEGKEVVKTMRKFLKDFLRLEAFRNCLDLWFVYCAFEYSEDREKGRKYFANTVQLMLSSTTANQDLLRFTLGFVRLELELDLIMQHFLYHSITGKSSSDSITSCTACTRRNFSGNMDTFREAEENSRNICLKFLISVISGGGNLDLDVTRKVSPVEIVRTIRLIQDRISTSEGGSQKTEDFQAMVFLIYLSKGLPEASELIQSELVTLQTNHAYASTERSHHLLHAQLLLREYHLQSNQPITARPLIASIQTVIRSALLSFPSDPLFLSLLVTIEIGFNHLWFKLRRHFGGDATAHAQFESYLITKYLNLVQNDSRQPTAQTQEHNWNMFMAALHSELLILDRASANAQDLTAFDVNTGVLNRIRHLFERALHYRDSGNSEEVSAISGNFLDDDWLYGKSLADCPTIWRLFFRFEIKCSQNSQRTDSTGGKAILYRALQNCPNHKSIYLDGINFFPELFEEFVDIMTDKQLRIRTTMEEVEMFVKAEKEKKGIVMEE